MTEILEIEFPRMVLNIRKVGNNSLLGALTLRFIENGYIKNIESLKPTEIVFVIKAVAEGVNLYNEINMVRDLLKIDEKKITVFIQ